MNNLQIGEENFGILPMVNEDSLITGFRKYSGFSEHSVTQTTGEVGSRDGS